MVCSAHVTGEHTPKQHLRTFTSPHFWSCLSSLFSSVPLRHKVFSNSPSPTPEGWLLVVGGGVGTGGRGILAAPHRLSQPLLCQSQASPSTWLMEFLSICRFWEAAWLPLGPSLWEHNFNLYFSAKRVNDPPLTFYLLKLQALWSAVSFLFSFS